MKLKELESKLGHVVGFEEHGNPHPSLEQYSTSRHIAASLIHMIEDTHEEIEGKVIGDVGCGCGILGLSALLLGGTELVAFDLDPDAISVAKKNFEIVGIPESQVSFVHCNLSLLEVDSKLLWEERERRKDEEEEEDEEEEDEEEEEEDDDDEEEEEEEEEEEKKEEKKEKGKEKEKEGEDEEEDDEDDEDDEDEDEEEEEDDEEEERGLKKVGPRKWPTNEGENQIPLIDTIVMNPPFGTKIKGIDMVFLQKAVLLSRGSVYSLHKTSTSEHIGKTMKAWGVSAEIFARMRFDIPKMYRFHKKDSVDVEVDVWRLYDLQDLTLEQREKIATVYDPSIYQKTGGKKKKKEKEVRERKGRGRGKNKMRMDGKGRGRGKGKGRR